MAKTVSKQQLLYRRKVVEKRANDSTKAFLVALMLLTALLAITWSFGRTKGWSISEFPDLLQSLWYLLLMILVSITVGGFIGMIWYSFKSNRILKHINKMD